MKLNKPMKAKVTPINLANSTWTYLGAKLTGKNFQNPKDTGGKPAKIGKKITNTLHVTKNK